jgi:peptide chain release factor 1
VISDDQLAQILSKHAELETALSGGHGKEGDFVRLSKEYADMGPAIEIAKQLQSLRSEVAGLEEILADTDVDAEMRDIATEELKEHADTLPKIEQRLQFLLLPKDEADERNAILEVRAGTGGDEAAIFAADLMRMYQRYAEARGWNFEVMSLSENDVGGYKDGSATISGRGVFERMKFESGVHRVQRVPVTESSGRIHTSTATVAVLPEAEEVDIQIDEKDIRVDVYRASGPGGQSVNTTDSAVRITHLETGIVVTQQDEKSQHKNRAKAMKIMRARLYEAERMARDSQRAAARRNQIGSGDRSERIRTYNFPQNRVTDHRINLTLHKLDRIILGEGLDEMIDALASEDQAARLAELDSGNAE